ncbi:hypothetical protein DY000_02040860 [Brassica cretica]|uniref:Uncharacterized protein n=1 Tax=Brassica cretica TaxID=69181 RepID=A0ABQ7BBP9_BRACR|nr:hypothetical protein DY000_02040860 [Brassica cretica]
MRMMNDRGEHRNLKPALIPNNRTLSRIALEEVPMIVRGVPTNIDQRRIAYGELTPSITMFG